MNTTNEELINSIQSLKDICISLREYVSKKEYLDLEGMTYQRVFTLKRANNQIMIGVLGTTRHECLTNVVNRFGDDKWKEMKKEGTRIMEGVLMIRPLPAK